jgi:hypothetical protein
LLWGLLIGQVLRDYAFHAIEALVGWAARALGVSRAFGDDALGYFTERLDPAPTRRALAHCVRRAKRNKAFDNSPFIGLSVDGTTVGRCRASKCPLCRPWRDRARHIRGYHHALALISVVGTGLVLPLDVERYGPRDSEYAAGQRLLWRTLRQVGPILPIIICGGVCPRWVSARGRRLGVAGGGAAEGQSAGAVRCRTATLSRSDSDSGLP